MKKIPPSIDIFFGHLDGIQVLMVVTTVSPLDAAWVICSAEEYLCENLLVNHR
jgi:hypothetical protein